MENEKDYKHPRGVSENYKRRWAVFLPSVLSRPNFSPVYIEQLKLLCDLFEDYDRIVKVLKKEKLFYETDGRYGAVIREHPAFKLKGKLLGEIRAYSKLLGLILDKDAGILNGDDDDDWS